MLRELTAAGDLQADLLVTQAEMQAELDRLLAEGTDPRQAEDHVLADAMENQQPLPIRGDDFEDEGANAEAEMGEFLKILPPE